MIFEITADHVAQLDDTKLRLLIGYLAEHELLKSGKSSASVTYGGHQNAQDGGVDVRVDLLSWRAGGYIPRARTAYQVKAENLSRNSIINEMRPDGLLRPAIVDLAKGGGSYIIVSSKGAASDTALTARHAAMREALGDLAESDNLHLDFYDGRRIASWVNENAGIAAWVREQLGQSFSGWRAFNDWSSSPDGLDSTYIADDHLRIRGSVAGERALSIIDGINRLRVLLHKDKNAVRIVGLSGVGKTRLIQALFDDRIGEESLNRYIAIYTDMGNNPNPVPLELLGRLQAHGQQCILIVDNCGIELHGKLVASQKLSTAPINIITVEYDVSDETPENTNVFRLEAASASTVEKMVRRRYPAFTQPEADAIAKFSEGNFRIAVALAETAKMGEPLTTLNDAELFKRLFRQKNEDNPALLSAAKTCALVFSFDTESLDVDKAELPFLAELARQHVDDLYGHVSELLRRQLVQKRGDWRAVLPQAIAHRLAKLALSDTPPARITNIFARAPQRLLKSFSRRLGYLHDVPQAKVIVDSWLVQGGLLAEIENFNSLGFTLLKNIAPVNVEEVLTGIELAWERSAGFPHLNNNDRRELVSLLRQLSYEPAQFDRAARLIARFAAGTGDSNNTSDAVNVFKSLFFIYFSGTMAGPKKRAAFIMQLAQTENEGDAKLALSALSAMLKVSHFRPSHGYEFGGLRRDYGYEPRRTEEIREWYQITLELCHALAELPHLRIEARKVLASQFGFLVRYTGLVDELVTLADSFRNNGGWPEGWAGVRNALRQSTSNASEEALIKLRELQTRLAPQNLANRISVYLRPQSWNELDIVETQFDDEVKYADAQIRAEAICTEIGRELACDMKLLATHMPDLISCESPRLGLTLAEIGEHSSPTITAWKIVRDAWIADRANSHWLIPAQFVEGVRKNNPSAFDQILDEALNDERLHDCFIAMQARSISNDEAMARIHRALALSTIPTRTFLSLIYGFDWREGSYDELTSIIRAVASREDGFDTAIEMTYAQINKCQQAKVPVPEAIKLAGRELLVNVEFTRRNDRQSDAYRLARMTELCLEGESDTSHAEKICANILAALHNPNFYPPDYAELIEIIAARFPRAVLDVIVDGAWNDSELPFLLSETRADRQNPIRLIDTGIMLNWAKEKPDSRYHALAYIIPIWTMNSKSDEPDPNVVDKPGVSGWTEIAHHVIRQAPDTISVLEILFTRFSPRSWSGSRAAIMRTRVILLEQLCIDENEQIRRWSKTALAEFQARIEREQETEADYDRRRDERFEW